ncbi:VanZ family protein [Cupriavidus sp. IDO]|uniref:VanZ family protein n=1 Tax=Cupriavidus sp. IDO TaxID=1539142 RepID=UPI0030837E2C
MLVVLMSSATKVNRLVPPVSLYPLTPGRWRLLFWPCAIAVLVLSLMPPTQPMPTTGWDKSNHALAFLVLALLGRRAYVGRGVGVLFALVAYGGLIELLQGMTSYRDADWADLLADSIGILLAVVVDWLLAKFSRAGVAGSRE